MKEEEATKMEEEARNILRKFYNDKNNAQIKNIYTLIASFFGVLISGKLDPLNLELYELFLLFVAPSFYFLARSSHWANYTWLMYRLKPVSKSPKNDNFVDNIFVQLRARDQPGRIIL